MWKHTVAIRMLDNKILNFKIKSSTISTKEEMELYICNNKDRFINFNGELINMDNVLYAQVLEVEENPDGESEDTFVLHSINF